MRQAHQSREQEGRYQYCLTKISVRANRSISRVFSLLIVSSQLFVHCPYKGRTNQAQVVLRATCYLSVKLTTMCATVIEDWSHLYKILSLSIIQTYLHTGETSVDVQFLHFNASVDVQFLHFNASVDVQFLHFTTLRNFQKCHEAFVFRWTHE